jgi:preprotein translocase subunit SecE
LNSTSVKDEWESIVKNRSKTPASVSTQVADSHQTSKVFLYAALASAVIGFGLYTYFNKNGMGQYSALALLAGLVLGCGLFWFSPQRPALFEYFQQVLVEGRKIVWPTPKETVQRAIVVFIFIVCLSTFLWIADSIYSMIFFKWLLGRA